MKTTIGGERLGSGNKQETSIKNYNRSSHDLSYLWRSTMAPGTLIPFMNKVALPGDSWDIDLDCEVLTLPTLGPLFGSFKVQLDVFQIPMRLYNAKLHMNMLNIGMDMSKVLLPQMTLAANCYGGNTAGDNDQINSSALVKYLGIAGLGMQIPQSDTELLNREFNAIPFLAYWEIYKNYYSNKQEEIGYVISTNNQNLYDNQTIETAIVYKDGEYRGNIYELEVTYANETDQTLIIQMGELATRPDPNEIVFIRGGVTTSIGAEFTGTSWNDTTKQLQAYTISSPSTNVTWEVPTQNPQPLEPTNVEGIRLQQFDLDEIDNMRVRILQADQDTVFNVNAGSVPYPYKTLEDYTGNAADLAEITLSLTQPLQGVGIKTYQSDLFNNWINTEWIDGTGGVNEISAVSTSGGSFTIDSLNIASKIYNMMNRIAVSGGTYDDWLDAVYTHERSKSVESPVYMGSLIKELAFQEVISNSASDVNGDQPLGELAGRGKLTNKNKGGKIKVKVDEPSYIMGIVSITPRIDYSQGIEWHTNLKTMNDLHKPALDGIGFQELITEQMAWQEASVSLTGEVTYKSAGKQPAWINYMTSVNKVYGHFAEENNSMFMTLNRNYDTSISGIEDLTTYIDPQKYNHIFAQTDLTAQNFWVQISNNITARRKMSAKIIPNL